MTPFPSEDLVREQRDAQERARAFNESEAVQREIEDRRELRRLLGPDSPLAEEVLNELDWLEVMKLHRQLRAVTATSK